MHTLQVLTTCRGLLRLPACALQRIDSRKVIKDDGHQAVVEFDQVSEWRFLWMHGEFTNKLRVTQERASRTVQFQLLSSSLMRDFTGSWVVHPHQDAREQDKSCHGFSLQRALLSLQCPQCVKLSDVILTANMHVTAMTCASLRMAQLTCCLPRWGSTHCNMS